MITLLNAHASRTTTPTPNTDQPKLAKSRLLVADALERDRAAATKPDAHDTATWLLEQLQALGWKSPPDPSLDLPPLRPAQPGDHRPHLEHIRAVLADPNHPDRAPRLDT